MLRAALAPLIVDAQDVGPNYSVRLRPHHQGRARAHVLFAGCDTLARSRSPRRVVTALLRFLDGRATERDGRRIQLDATALVSDRRAIVVPPQLRAQLAAAEDELAQRGLGHVDGPVLLDPERDEVVVPPVHDLGMDEPAGPPTPDVATGRFAVAAWAWYTRADGHRATPAEITAQANRLVRNRDAAGGQRVLEAMARSAPAAVHWLPAGRTATTQLLDLLTAKDAR